MYLAKPCLYATKTQGALENNDWFLQMKKELGVFWATLAHTHLVFIFSVVLRVFKCLWTPPGAKLCATNCEQYNDDLYMIQTYQAKKDKYATIIKCSPLADHFFWWVDEINFQFWVWSMLEFYILTFIQTYLEA